MTRRVEKAEHTGRMRALEQTSERKDGVMENQVAPDGKNACEIRCREMLVSMRRITQAISLHSRDLSRRYGLTGPQLAVLNALSGNEEITVTELARSISATQATVTDMLNRLEKRGLIERRRNSADRRRVTIRPTDECRKILSKAPPPLQETFLEGFANLPEWEQLMILSAFKRVVDLMSAEKIEAPAILSTDPLQG